MYDAFEGSHQFERQLLIQNCKGNFVATPQNITVQYGKIGTNRLHEFEERKPIEHVL